MEKKILKGGEFLISPMENSDIFMHEELPEEIIEIGTMAAKFVKEKVYRMLLIKKKK